jgi:hypothetical protein
VTQNFSCEVSLLISVYVIRIFNLYNRLSSCSRPEVNDLKPKINFNVLFRPNVVQYQKKCLFFKGCPSLRSPVLLIRMVVILKIIVIFDGK